WSWGCYAALKLAALVIFYCAWWWRAKKFTKTNPPLPPGPRGLPIIANLPFIRVMMSTLFGWFIGMERRGKQGFD
ncbi:hypothetical protein Gorai_017671, partial [Gossypium raimondii]|nr:hypothetical protein [Gossypium raimondii]